MPANLSERLRASGVDLQSSVGSEIFVKNLSE